MKQLYLFKSSVIELHIISKILSNHWQEWYFWVKILKLIIYTKGQSAAEQSDFQEL